MNLSITRDGKKEPYSEQQFRLDNPCTSFPKGLAGVDLAAYGVEIEPELEKAKEEPKVVEKIVERVVTEVKKVARTVPPDPTMVPMHCFLWGLREFNLRTQAERYFPCRGTPATTGSAPLTCPAIRPTSNTLPPTSG